MMNSLTNNIVNTTVVVKLDTDLVSSHSTDMRDKLRSLIAGGARSVTLDFSEVRMVDSAGLGTIIAAHNSLRKIEGELMVRECSAEILELFHSMRLHQHMSVEGKVITPV